MRAGATPSITRLFAATFIAVALVGLVTQIATWRSARATQMAMVELAQRLDRIQRLGPSPLIAAEATAATELAADAGDDAVQAALAASVLFAAMVGVLGLGFWYNRRRLAVPFSRVAQALQRVAEGQFVEPLPEDQPGEFGAIARGVNRMAKALAWREALQAYLSQLLAALNTSSDDSATGLGQALGVIAGATRATGIVLYQPAYDANEWAPTVSRDVRARRGPSQHPAPRGRGAPDRQAAGTAERRSRCGDEVQRSVFVEHLARAAHAAQQHHRIHRPAAHGGHGSFPVGSTARFPRDGRAQRAPPARADQRAARPAAHRRGTHGAQTGGGGPGRVAHRDDGERAGAGANTSARAGRDAPVTGPAGAGRPGPRAPGAPQPALERHQVHARRRPYHGRRGAGQRRGGGRSPGRGDRPRDRHRGRGSAQAVSGILPARRVREPEV